MLDKIKEKMFPCTAIINQALEDNYKATNRLIAACRVPRDRPTFPEFKEGLNVNPR